MRALEVVSEFLFGGDIVESVFVTGPSTYSEVLDLREVLAEEFAAEGEELPMRLQVEEGLEDGQVVLVNFLSGGLLRGPRAESYELTLGED